jgi:hypothetical protein
VCSQEFECALDCSGIDRLPVGVQRSSVAHHVRDVPLPLWPKFPVSDVHEIATKIEHY